MFISKYETATDVPGCLEGNFGGLQCSSEDLRVAGEQKVHEILTSLGFC